MTKSNTTLETYYADMNDRQDAAKLEEQMRAAEREEKERLETTVQDISILWSNAKAGEAVPFAEAITSLAAMFYVPSTNTDADGNHYNDTMFQLRGMLGNLCQNGKWMLENAQQHENELWQKLDQVEAEATGDEISLRNLNQVMDQLERARTVQVPACKDFLANAKAAYEAIIGEPWKPFVKKGASAETQNAAAVRARLAALRGK